MRDSERGSILIMMALSMAVLFGVAALSLDISFMYDKRNRLHAAADAAAKSAAFEVVRDRSISLVDLTTFANHQVSRHGFNPAGTTIVTVANCGSSGHAPCTGAFTGNDGYVEVIVSEPTSTFFGIIAGLVSMTPGARAVAGTANPQACLVTLGPKPTDPFSSLEIGNSFDFTGCGVAVGGDLRGTNPNATINGPTVPSVGVMGICRDSHDAPCDSCSTPGSDKCMGKFAEGAPRPNDPLAGLAAPTNPGGCIAGVVTTLNPGCYTNISPDPHFLNPGVYYMTGTVNAANLSGVGVMIYLTGTARIRMGNNSEMHLSAPTSGPYTGIAIFQDQSDNQNFDADNHATVDVTGAIYMPGTDVSFENHLIFGNSTCTLFIAHSLDIRNGSGNITNSGCAATFGAGGAKFLSVSIAE